MKWAIENWYWILSVALPVFTMVGLYVSKFTKTDKDDKFFERLKQVQMDLMKGISQIKSLPTPEEVKKQETKKDDKKK